MIDERLAPGTGAGSPLSTTGKRHFRAPDFVRLLARKWRSLLALLVATGVLSGTVAAFAQDSPDEAALTLTIAALDAKVFDAYNRCDLNEFARYFSPKVEFYHDKAGATFDRETVIASTRKYICHKVRRELLPATFRVYPIKDYGAIEEGEHRFCQTSSGECEGSAKFLMIWQHKGGKWLMTRIISYGHRALTEEEKSVLSPQSGG